MRRAVWICVVAQLVIGLFVYQQYRRSKPEFFVSMHGNDTHSCRYSLLRTDDCATLSHAMSLIPSILDKPYTVYIDDGVYNEPLDIQGFSGTTYGIEVIGNNR